MQGRARLAVLSIYLGLVFVRQKLARGSKRHETKVDVESGLLGATTLRAVGRRLVAIRSIGVTTTDGAVASPRAVTASRRRNGRAAGDTGT